MKVTGLLLITFGLVAFAQATLEDYRLGCTNEEMGIRWPSYASHSDYYVCPRIGGRQMTITCNPGEVFTYVLQSCTKPSQYIPAPALRLLKIASNKPAGPSDIQTGAHPPIVSDIPFLKPQQPPVWPVDAPKLPLESVEEPKHEAKPITNEEHKTEEQEIVNSGKPSVPVQMPPMPPTPAPTPPVVEPVVPIKSIKKPSLNKKPTVAKKKSSAKLNKNSKKKPTAEMTAKKPQKNSPKTSPKNSKKTPPKKAPTKA